MGSQFSCTGPAKNGTQDTAETKDVSISEEPKDIVRTITQDREGNIWTSSASANHGMWVLSRYDGKTITDFKSAAGQQ